MTGQIRRVARFLAEQVPAAARSREWMRQARDRRRFAREFETFCTLNAAAQPRFGVSWQNRYPCLADRTASMGFDRHYVYHTAWAARVLAQIRPSVHIDISSSVYFCSIVSAFVPIRFYDYRAVDLDLSALTSGTADLTKLVFDDQSIESLSCMHVVEHVGLGRYGDPLDPDGDLEAMAELQRVVAPGGSLLFVVPVGRPVVRFNAHRIYSYRQVIDAFDKLDLQEWALVPDHGEVQSLIRNAPETTANDQDYACGCFWFRRRQRPGPAA